MDERSYSDQNVRSACHRLWRMDKRGSFEFIGTAFFISSCNLLSAKHVVQNLDGKLFFSGQSVGGIRQIKEISFHQSRDVAMLTVDELRDAVLIQLSEDDLEVSDDGAALGFSSSYEEIDNVPCVVYSYAGVQDTYSFTPPIALGMSGGPFLKSDGRLGGIVFGRDRDRERGFVVPIQAFRAFVEEIRVGEFKTVLEKYPLPWAERDYSSISLIFMCSVLVVLFPALYWEVNHLMRLIADDGGRSLQAETNIDPFMWAYQLITMSIFTLPSMAMIIKKRFTLRENHYNGYGLLMPVYILGPVLAMIVLGYARKRISVSGAIFAGLQGIVLFAILLGNLPDLRRRVHSCLRLRRSYLSEIQRTELTAIRAYASQWLWTYYGIIGLWVVGFCGLVLVATFLDFSNIYKSDTNAERAVIIILWPTSWLTYLVELLILGVVPIIGVNAYIDQLLNSKLS